jgi:hypothetical protein
MPPIEQDAVLHFQTGDRTNPMTMATENKKVYNFEGFPVQTDAHVRIVTGPVVGKVTTSSVVILLEVSGKGFEEFNVN